MSAIDSQIDLWGAEHSAAEAARTSGTDDHRENYKQLHARRLRLGIHPLTAVALRDDVLTLTCKSCQHRVLRGQVAGRYWKCLKGPITGGPATDVRASWPACVLYEQKAAQ